ncbi:hypothetical protein SRB17_74960 [Streptomyces sp. RB17]|uniref:hypothetical protein n=1 Tax=Streptomyces sp. RB17 TaxID=2585197 RepID=UPI0012955F6E|nr:hypothetical protein [Streptomyces sp. RB17]MQY39469.1 hypothetical protein [Streptomyces sp. RB17]
MGEIFDPPDLAELRALTTTGEFTGDIRRCPGSPTVALLDSDGDFSQEMSWPPWRLPVAIGVQGRSGSRGRSPLGVRHTLPR